MPYKRPLNEIPLGKVWRRFTKKNKDGLGTETAYQIRDIEDSRKEECLNLCQAVFLKDEPLCDFLDLTSDTESVATILDNWTANLEEQVSLACYTEDPNGEPDELVSVALSQVLLADDEEFCCEIKGEAWRKILKVMTVLDEQADIFQHYNVDKYFSINVITVLNSHRGYNIGKEMFEASMSLARALGLKAIATVCTAKGSQVIACRCGFEKITELQYEELLQYGLDLTQCSCTNAIAFGRQL